MPILNGRNGRLSRTGNFMSNDFFYSMRTKIKFMEGFFVTLQVVMGKVFLSIYVFCS